MHISSAISSLNNGISCPPSIVLWYHDWIKQEIPKIAKRIIIILFLVLFHPSLIIAILLGGLVISTELKMLSHQAPWEFVPASLACLLSMFTLQRMGIQFCHSLRVSTEWAGYFLKLFLFLDPILFSYLLAFLIAILIFVFLRFLFKLLFLQNIGIFSKLLRLNLWFFFNLLSGYSAAHEGASGLMDEIVVGQDGFAAMFALDE